MQNRIYTILANMYNELKAFKNGKSIDLAVKDIVDKSEEVSKARGSYTDLDGRIQDIQTKVNELSIDLNEVDCKIDTAATDVEAKIPKFNTAVIHDDKREMIVSLDNRALRKEDLLTITAGQSATLVNDDKSTITKAYMNSMDAVAATKSIVFNDNGQLEYNKEINDLDSTNHLIVSKALAEMYELPLLRANIFETPEYDACIVDNLCTIVSDYNSPFTNDDGTINYTNHIVNAFNDKGAWHVKRSFVSFVLTFNEAIELAKILVDFDTNSAFKECKIEYSSNGTTWSTLTDSFTKINYTLPSNISLMYIRVSINVFDGSVRYINLNDIKIYTTNYNGDSEPIMNIDPVVLDNTNDSISIKTKSPSDSSKYILTKYAVTNLMDNEERPLYTYIPKTFNLLPNDFYDSRGYRCINPTLKNNVKLDVASKVLFYPLEKNYTPLTSVIGQLGNCSIIKEKTYSQTYGWKPNIDNMFRVYISINGGGYWFPLHIDNINKDMLVTVGGAQIKFRINIVKSNTIMVHISSTTLAHSVVVDSVRVDVMSSHNFVYDAYSSWTQWWWSSWFNNQCGSTVSNDKTPVSSLLNLISLYQVNMTYYIYNGQVGWNWQTWGGWNYSWTYTYSGYNRSESVSACIIPHDAYSGTDVISTAVEEPMYRTTIEKRGCTLPVSVYMTSENMPNLQNTIANTSQIDNIVNSPVFSYEQEYTSKVFIANADVTSILPQQTASDVNYIEYAISFDGYSYFVIDRVTGNWIPYLGTGMVNTDMLSLNETILNKIRHKSEWLYIKVKIIDPSSSVQNITINFDKYRFITISKSEIMEKGVTKRVIESITPDILQDTIFNVSPVMYIASEAKTTYPCYRYKMAGYDIYNNKNIQWQEVDGVNIKEYLLGDNALLYKNLSTKTYQVKVIRNIFKNQTAVITDELNRIGDITDLDSAISTKLLEGSKEINCVNALNEVFQYGVNVHDKVVTALMSKSYPVTTDSTWEEILIAINEHTCMIDNHIKQRTRLDITASPSIPFRTTITLDNEVSEAMILATSVMKFTFDNTNITEHVCNFDMVDAFNYTYDPNSVSFNGKIQPVNSYTASWLYQGQTDVYACYETEIDDLGRSIDFVEQYIDSDASLSITSVPFKSVVIPNTDINLMGINKLKQMTISSQGYRFAISFDGGITYYSWYNGGWIQVDLNDLSEVNTRFMTNTTLNSLVTDNFEQIRNGSTKLRIALYSDQLTSSTTYYVDDLDVVMDIHGHDDIAPQSYWSYKLLGDRKTIEYTFYQSGTYTINYI